MTQAKPIKCLLVGCGRIGTRHAELLNRHQMLAAVCDIQAEQRNFFSEKYQVPAFAQLSDYSGDANLLVVCTPNGLHAAHSIWGLQNGMHVLCEKPMAIRYSDAQQMIQAAQNTGKNLWIVKQNRFNPPVVALKRLIEAGRLGKIYSVQCQTIWHRPATYYQNTWKGSLELDGGTLFTQFSHFIDIVIWLFGRIKLTHAAQANLAHPYLEIEDSGSLSGHFETGGLFNMQYSVNAPFHNLEGSITVVAEYAAIKIGGQYMNTLEYVSPNFPELADLPPGNESNQYGFYQGSMSNHPQVYTNFISHLNTERAALLPALFEAADTVRLIEEAYQWGKNR